MFRPSTFLKSASLSAALVAVVACSDAASESQSANAQSTAMAVDRTAASAPAVAEVQPVAIELFTSQGCSSCPPADRLAAELVDRTDLVIVTRPVTYWDRLGWRDTLGREENSELQRTYAQSLVRGGGRAYTPQAVVDGRFGLVGSRRGELREAIADAKESRSGVSITVSETDDGGRTVLLDGDIGADARIELVALDSSETVAIGRGENRGRTVTYTNVLRDERSLGSWIGGAQTLTIDAADLQVAEVDRHALIVRQGEAGRILAARYL